MKTTGLSNDFDTTQGTITLRRPGHDDMKLYAAGALPYMDDDADALAIIESEDVKNIMYAAVTDSSRELLDELRKVDFIGYVELWKAFSAFCRFKELFILPLEAAQAKQRKAQSLEMGTMFAAMIEGGVVTREQVGSIMQGEMTQVFGRQTSSSEPASTSSSGPTTAGAAATSDAKTTG